MTNNKPAAPLAQALTVADLPTNRATTVLIIPDAAQRQALASEMGLLALRKLRFNAVLTPLGKSDWHLTSTLGATVVQACVISLDPVTTRIDEKPERKYLRKLPEPDPGSEQEIPEDDTLELIGPEIDPVQIMLEALTLALPLFPRAGGAKHEQQNFTEPGKKPMSDADSRPFAQLLELQKGLKNDTE